MNRSMIVAALIAATMATNGRNGNVTFALNRAMAQGGEVAFDTTEVSMNPRIRNAISVWDGYRAALKDGDREKAMGYWTGKSTRAGRAFDWLMPDFEQAVSIARSDYLDIAGLEEHGDFIQLDVTSPRKKNYTYYVVQAEGGTFLANPVEVLTNGWEEEETDHFICHYAEGDGPSSDQLKDLDAFYRKLSSYLDIDLGRKIDYYKCDSRQLVGDLFGMPAATGRAYYRNYALAATKWTSFHEVVHVLLGQTCQNQPTSLILEGAACYFGGSSLVTRDAQLAWARTLVENGESLPISSILQEKGFWAAEDMNDSYAEAAAFAGFLLVDHGINKFKQLYKYRDATEDVEAEIERIYGKKIAQLEDEWTKWLLQLDVPTIELGRSSNATEIFGMNDPANDDNGDGDYTYPLASEYHPGMFDLLDFKVLEGQGRVGFELKYRDLVEWKEDSDWGFGGTYTRIAIDCGGSGGDSFGRDARASLSGNRDYLINVSDCGVIVWHDGRVEALLKRPLPGEKLGDSNSDCIRFSVPRSETQSPPRSWRYTVAVGGTSERGKHLRDGVGSFLDVDEHRTEQTGGGGTDTAFNPNVYDLLLPGSENQEKILGAYNATNPGKLVVLPMVGR